MYAVGERIDHSLPNSNLTPFPIWVKMSPIHGQCFLNSIPLPLSLITLLIPLLAHACLLNLCKSTYFILP